MSKTQKSAQDSSKSASSNSQVSLFPTAKSPSLTTATDSIDARNVPTAHSRSTKTGIGANTSDFERPVGMSDTSAGSSQQNSKIEASTALSATSPQLLLNDLRRGQLFGKQSQSQSQQTNNNQTLSTTTFTSTTFTSTASEPSDTEDSSLEKSTQPEKSAKSTRTPRSQSRILSVLEKKREKNNSKSKKSLKSKKGTSKKIVKSKMNGSESSKKAKKNRAKNNDESSKRVPAVRSMVPTNSSCSDAATSHSSLSSTKSQKRKEPLASKEFPEIAGVSLSSSRTARKKNQNVDESVRMVNYAPLNNGLTDISKKPPSSIVYPPSQTIQSQRYPLIPGQSPSLTNLSARVPVQENFAPGPISKQSVRYPIQQQVQPPKPPSARRPGEQKTLRSTSRGQKKEHHFPGAGRSLKTLATPTEIKPVGDGSLKDHCVYDISNLNNSQRRLPPKAPPKSLFGSARAPQPQQLKPSEPNSGNKVVIYGTTADGKNQVEFTVQMRIVAGEAVGANQNQPVDVLPKKVVVGGKEISVEKNRNESMNL